MTEHFESEQSKNEHTRKKIDELVAFVREQNRQKPNEYVEYDELIKDAFNNLRFNLDYTLGKVEGGDHGSAQDIKEAHLEQLRQAIDEFKKLLPE